jgi:hypothetical protein
MIRVGASVGWEHCRVSTFASDALEVNQGPLTTGRDDPQPPRNVTLPLFVALQLSSTNRRQRNDKDANATGASKGTFTRRDEGVYEVRSQHPSRIVYKPLQNWGCPWEDVPLAYGSPTTCWRRFSAWSKDGTWERMWWALLRQLDA